MDDFDTYQERTGDTAIYPGYDSDRVPEKEAVMYTALGFAGEAGEAAEKVKKYHREGDIEYLEDLEDELGDALWYLARLADEVELSLSRIAQGNLDKLQDRQDRGVLTGEGDNR